MQNTNLYLVRHLDRIDNEDCGLEETRLWNSTYRKDYLFQINPYLCKSNNKLKKIMDNLTLQGNPSFDHIICSPFLRCIETAILIKNNYPNIKDTKININFNLSELVCEDYLFKMPTDIATIYNHSKKYLEANYKDYELNELNIDLKFDDFETDENYEKRIKAILKEIKSKYSGNILIVTHKDALNLNMKYGEIYKLSESVNLDGGYYQKYLKYKAKYLKLKNLI